MELGDRTAIEINEANTEFTNIVMSARRETELPSDMVGLSNENQSTILSQRKLTQLNKTIKRDFYRGNQSDLENSYLHQETDNFYESSHS